MSGASRGNAARAARLIPAICALALCLALGPAGGAADDDIEVPQASVNHSITIAADQAVRWPQGSYEIWILRGNVYLNQGLTYARSQEAVLWIEHGEQFGNQPTKIIAYFESEVSVSFLQSPGQPGAPENRVANIRDKSWFGRFYTAAPLKMQVPRVGPEPVTKPAVYERAMARFDPQWGRTIQRAQFSQIDAGPLMAGPLPRGARRLRAFPRSDVRVQAQWFPSAGGQEWVAVVSAGVNLIIDGMVDGRPLDIAADRMVIWTTGAAADFTGQTLQSDDTPLELYMEGNIVFRDGDRVIQADRMYYDVTRRIGVVLDVEMLTPARNYEGLLRLRAGILRQLDRDHFVAHDGGLTSSRIGNPRYEFRSDMITFEDVQHPIVDFAGNPVIDPLTGEPAIEHQRLAEATNNLLYLGPVPVLYWPTMATDLREPTFYVDSLALKQDAIFGTQLQVGLHAYQVLGIRNPPEGTRWHFDVDYLSERGLGLGTRFDYDRPELFGLPGRAHGFIDAWGIRDHGFDNLGRGRRRVAPETDFRGRIQAQHRHRLENNYTLTAELGLISDRNFLEQYFENDWDRRKDQTTGVELKQLLENQSWSISSDVRLNDFFTQTEWLPRLDHFWLGQSLLWDRLTWYEHTSLSYARLRTATIDPLAPDPARFPLAWEADVQGERLITRQEIDLPMQVGPFKLVAYGLGELAHWGEALDGDDLQRAYGQAGLRASIPFWTADPTVQSHLLNLNGLAHKVVFDAEFSYTDSSANVEELPLYEQLDDDAQEHFRRRFFFNTFGGVGDNVPLRFDERNYAVRAGLHDWVTSPSMEIADDLMAVRMGMRNRWQTKRGRAGQERIIDWIVLDANATIFPKDERDNFGETVGLADYDFRWHVGDRLTLVSDGFYDFFDNGLKTTSVGAFLNRPPRMSIYLGFRRISGPVDSATIAARIQYWMSPKWISAYIAGIDLANEGNIGQRFIVSRVGESFLVHLGMNHSESKGIVGATLLVEPRFLTRLQRRRDVNVVVPPAGAFGLE